METETKRIEVDESVRCIPDDVINDILIRLPAKSLCRFRCLSHGWNFSLTDTKFISNHTIQILNRKDEQKLVCFLPRTRSFYSLNLETFISSSDRIMSFDNYKNRSLAPSIRNCDCSTIGSSNGLICIKYCYRRMDEVFLIINPLTQECRKVTYPGEDFLSKSKMEHQCYGFAYSLTTCDYKIVKIRQYYDHYAVDVFSPRNNCWRTEEKEKRRIPHLESNSIGEVGGVLYWKFRSIYRHYIFTFDLGTNKCGMLKDIPKDEDEFHYIVGVNVFEGCLCVTRRRLGGYSFWMMKKYGGAESWTKLMHIKSKIKPGYRLHQPRLVHYANNKKLLLLQDRNANLYRIEDGFVMSGKNLDVMALDYKETLISP